jgi:hypothetical protein
MASASSTASAAIVDDSPTTTDSRLGRIPSSMTILRTSGLTAVMTASRTVAIISIASGHRYRNTYGRIRRMLPGLTFWLVIDSSRRIRTGPIPGPPIMAKRIFLAFVSSRDASAAGGSRVSACQGIRGPPR